MSVLASRIAAKRNERERNYIDVEEWGDDGDPVRLYFSEMTARDMEKIQRKHPNILTNTTMASMVDAIIIKCEDDKGEPAFSLEDKPVLMGETVAVVGKIFAAVFSSKSIEEQEKN